MKFEEFKKRLEELPLRYPVDFRDRLTCGVSEGIKVEQFPRCVESWDKVIVARVSVCGDTPLTRVEVKAMGEDFGDADFERACVLLGQADALRADALQPVPA
ncbi:MAG: hypothetical protein HYW65_02355 [Candidatus Liptonbacteria bacterium]|nr:hypothetical protein [Candidatus Liptonbacteria bacterium]